ncbi:reverse transcriptase domain-containing protein [Tanacetum coccineum]
MSIQLADRSIKYPIGVCENLLVKINKFIFSVDFMVLEMDEDDLVPIIFRRPLLATARAVIDVYEGKLSLRFGKETITFNIGKLIKSAYTRDDYLCCTDHTTKHFPRKMASATEPPKLELKETPEHLEYAFLQDDDQLLIVISSALSAHEKTMLLEAVPKEGEMTMIRNELIPQRTVTGWRVCIDYRKLNDTTQKDHFLLPFIDQMLERFVGDKYYYFLDGFLRYFQIPIALEDQEKTTFTCPYGTFAYKRMSIGLCNAPATFQLCMMAIFHELIKESIEVFMDDFFVFRNSFDHCLANLENMLKRCEETNLVLNWEKCHFIVREGIVIGHKVFGAGIEVAKAKIESLSKLPYPTNTKAIRSFLEHVGFYRRFINHFSQVGRTITQLLVKDAPFIFLEECIQAFDRLKRELTQAPMMIKPDRLLPFKIMCNTSDYVVGTVLGQRKDKHFQPIHYASRTMNDAQENYTTTEKELLAIVFAFDKFCQYLEFDIEIRDKEGAKNLAANHLSRLEIPYLGKLTKVKIRDLYLEEQLMMISNKSIKPWYADYANYLASRVLRF